MRAFSVSYFHPAPTFHLHKSTQTITSSHEYKAITDSLRVEIILTLLWRPRYNYHANLAHQQFKTLSVIISRIKPQRKKKRKKPGEGEGGGVRGEREKREIMPEQVPITSARATPPAGSNRGGGRLLPTTGVEWAPWNAGRPAWPRRCPGTRRCAPRRRSASAGRDLKDDAGFVFFFFFSASIITVDDVCVG